MFIEVTDSDGEKILVNTDHVEMIMGNTVYFAFNIPDGVEHDYIECKETYDEIKEMIFGGNHND